MKKEEIIERLNSYVEALRPILYVETFDFQAFDEVIDQIKGNEEIYEYNESLGYVDWKTKQQKTAYNLEMFLLYSLEETKPAFLILKDIHHQLDNPKIISLLKSIALKHIEEEVDFRTTIFIVSTRLIVPIELEKLITVCPIPLPENEEIYQMIKDFSQNFSIQENFIDQLALSLRGFSEFEIRQILKLAYQTRGSIQKKELPLILQEKEQIIKKSGMIEIVNFEGKIEEIGGLKHLKKWLKNKAEIFKRLEEAIKYGVEIPKGVMILGTPGCGKSITAKATATLFEVPLLRLDVGKLLGKYVGESEENMRRSIQIAEAVSPCVLWIDEIEKAFSGIGKEGGHEVTTRLFGSFLTWLQEKNSSVFVVATSNDISGLPPEFLRKGRFDEIFFVDLPTGQERKSIFELHLKKRHKWNQEINTIELIKKTEHYNGSDIEAVVKETIEMAFLQNSKKITTDDISKVIQETKPMSIALKEKIDKLKKEIEKLDVKRA